MRIVIETIPHKDQVYPTVGDWRRDADGTLRIRVSEEVGEDSAFLVALHEMVESKLCEKQGITCEQVDQFDKDFEKNRKEGDFSEPGDSPEAPYRRQHIFADVLEKVIANEMRVHWELHEWAINNLP
jgi:hypothetical protein